MAKSPKSSAKKGSHKKPIEHYEHKDKKRVNNPPVGLVTPETDKDKPAKKYAYDPHIDPALQFDSKRSQIEKIIDPLRRHAQLLADLLLFPAISDQALADETHLVGRERLAAVADHQAHRQIL